MFTFQAFFTIVFFLGTLALMFYILWMVLSRSGLSRRQHYHHPYRPNRRGGSQSRYRFDDDDDD